MLPHCVRGTQTLHEVLPHCVPGMGSRIPITTNAQSKFSSALPLLGVAGADCISCPQQRSRAASHVRLQVKSPANIAVLRLNKSSKNRDSDAETQLRHIATRNAAAG